MQFDKQLGALKQKLDSRVIQDILPYDAYPLVRKWLSGAAMLMGRFPFSPSAINYL